VHQNARLGVAGLNGDEGTFTELAEGARKAPQLQLWDNPRALAELQKGTIALRNAAQRQVRLVGGPGRRGGQARAADLLHQIHRLPRLLQPTPATGVIVHDPLGKADGALDAQAGVADASVQVAQAAALLDVALQLPNPRLDALIPGPARDIDDFHQG